MGCFPLRLTLGKQTAWAHRLTSEMGNWGASHGKAEPELGTMQLPSAPGAPLPSALPTLGQRGLERAGRNGVGTCIDIAVFAPILSGDLGPDTGTAERGALAELAVHRRYLFRAPQHLRRKGPSAQAGWQGAPSQEPRSGAEKDQGSGELADREGWAQSSAHRGHGRGFRDGERSLGAVRGGRGRGPVGHTEVTAGGGAFARSPCPANQGPSRGTLWEGGGPSPSPATP